MKDAPHTVHDDLTSDRLSTVGLALAEARDSAQLTADRNLGDDAWSIGCTAYRRSCTAIVALAERVEWLSILAAGMEFQFRIGEVPVRFYHGDSEAPPTKHSSATQIEMEFPAPSRGAEGVFRLAVETTDKGFTSSVNLIQVVNSEVINNWGIWTRTPAQATPKSEGMELDPPVVQHFDEKAAPDTKRATGTGDGS